MKMNPQKIDALEEAIHNGSRIAVFCKHEDKYQTIIGCPTNLGYGFGSWDMQEVSALYIHELYIDRDLNQHRIPVEDIIEIHIISKSFTT